MCKFQKFADAFGEPACQAPVSEDIIAANADTLPDELLEFWDVYGLCSFGDGLIWMVDPADFKDVIEDWVPQSEYQPEVVFRTSFGSMTFWNSSVRGFHFLNVVRAEVRVLLRSARMLVNRFLAAPAALDSDLLRPMHNQALERLGPIRADECYAFEPAVAMGGDVSADNLSIQKLEPHLNILSQLKPVVDLD